MAKSFLIHDHDGTNLSPNPHHEVVYKLTGDETDGLFDYFDLRVGYLEGFPMHIHIGQHETFHVVDGELLLQHDGDWVVAKKGDFVFVPKNTLHTFANVRRTIAHSIGVICPGGFDKFVEGMITATKSGGGRADPKKIEELCIQFNQKLTGPTLAVSLDLLPPPEKAAEFEKEMDALQGRWTLVESDGPRDGKKSPEELLRHPGSVEVDGNKVRITVKGVMDIEGVARFDPTATPKTIDFLNVSEGDPRKGKTALGIYELQGDTLTWSFKAGFDIGRPSEFRAGKDVSQSLEVFVRQKG